jgi:hypothetical protein
LAAALKHSARVSAPEAGGDGLTANQWNALRYFAEANRFSRTVSAYAAYNATTRGTASQTIKLILNSRFQHLPGFADRFGLPASCCHHTSFAARSDGRGGLALLAEVPEQRR